MIAAANRAALAFEGRDSKAEPLGFCAADRMAESFRKLFVRHCSKERNFRRGPRAIIRLKNWWDSQLLPAQPDCGPGSPSPPGDFGVGESAQHGVVCWSPTRLTAASARRRSMHRLR